MPSRLSCFARQALTFKLGDLILVARPERGVFVGRRMLDIPVDAHGAAVNHASHSGAGCSFDDVPNGRRVDRLVDLALDARLPVDRGEVIHDLDPGGRRLERGAVADVPDRQLDALRLEVAGAAGIPNKRAHCLAPGGQGTGQMASGEPRCTGYERVHRSATSVTGDPKRLSRPIRLKSDSEAAVNRRDPTAL